MEGVVMKRRHLALQKPLELVKRMPNKYLEPPNLGRIIHFNSALLRSLATRSSVLGLTYRTQA